MYNNFFGFKERPFKLVPNPAYLYLSKSHEEAFAHLSYAVSQGDGFVEITGEVGTGKTTLCRAFLESLDEDIISAYIFNPKLTVRQLLKAINDEFGIPSDSDSVKELIDVLNIFLIEQHSQGKKVILIIDEAQNLSKSVIEQIRLLSNLETATSKLIQIILVGQPELSEILESYELRQLAQRITLHWHITPMSQKETTAYIKHRLHVASSKSGVEFAKSAFSPIYKFSEGTPRLINIVCDRTLLIAYGLNRRLISSSIVRSAIKEVGNQSFSKRNRSKRKIWIPIVITITAIVFAFGLFYIGFMKGKYEMGGFGSSSSYRIDDGSELDLPGIEPLDTLQDTSQDQGLSQFLSDFKTSATRHNALSILLSRWEKEASMTMTFDEIKEDATFFQVASNHNGFSICRLEKELEMIRQLNLPAIFSFTLSNHPTPIFLTLTKIENDEYCFQWGRNETEKIRIPSQVMELNWEGYIMIPWKNFYNISGTIPDEASFDAIISLKTILKDIGFKTIEINGTYDKNVEAIIKKIQKKYGLEENGRVDVLTKIAIYNENSFLKIPHIMNY